MAKYVNPKADLTFKKVFGEHKDLLVSFLNALLPLQPEQEIVEVEYMPSELVPDNPDKYWDAVSRERTSMNAAERRGEARERMRNALKMKQKVFDIADIAEITDLKEDEIRCL